ncbi:hypothetical protein [Aquisalimonas sp.]|uniref:hypothetical protein n=1 Tax=Aquisalimonas sp. TaxID=1872621 RepID=UPI0025B89721|nr:hypothetical protein [Aquisalimonas sp.]
MHTEEGIVLAGVVRIGGVTLGEGDSLHREPVEKHDVVAVSDAINLVSLQKGTPVIE